MESTKRVRWGQANRTSRTKFFMSNSVAERSPDERPCVLGASRRAPIIERRYLYHDYESAAIRVGLSLISPIYHSFPLALLATMIKIIAA